MTNFIKLQYAEDLEHYTDQAIFLGAIQIGSIFDTDNINRINEMLEAYDCLTIEESILPFFESAGYPIEALAKLYNDNIVGDDPADFEDFEDFQDNNISNVISAAAYDTSAFIMDMFYYIEDDQGSSDDIAEAFIDYLGLQTFTAGYSPWSRVITFKEHDQEFYKDLYNGWNFYDLFVVDEQGETIDVVCSFYIQTEQELRDEVKGYFGFDSFKLIDNEAAVWFDIEKAEKIVHYK